MTRTLEDYLPCTTDDSLLDALSMEELMRFQRVSKDAQYKVASYIRRNFHIPPVLEPFISSTDIEDFRRLMARTETIISGSTALQFFARVRWPTSDLDLFVNKAHAREVAAWLIEHNYTFQPSSVLDTEDEEEETWEKTTEFTPYTLSNSNLCFEPPEMLGYGEGNTVLNFVHNKTGRMIQVIMCYGTPLYNVLEFHSTAVMNVITHESAYCIHPKATLDEKITLYRPSHFSAFPHVLSALNKYTNRGWQVIHRLPDHGAFGLSPLFPFGSRRVTDEKSLKIRWLPPLDLPTSNIGHNSWGTSYDSNMIPHIHGVFCRANRLRSTYIFTCDRDEHWFQLIWKKLQEMFPGESFLDDEFAAMIKQ